MASSLFNLRAWRSFFTISLQVFFGLALGLAPSTSYSIYFFTQSLSELKQRQKIANGATTANSAMLIDIMMHNYCKTLNHQLLNSQTNKSNDSKLCCLWSYKSRHRVTQESWYHHNLHHLSSCTAGLAGYRGTRKAIHIIMFKYATVMNCYVIITNR